MSTPKPTKQLEADIRAGVVPFAKKLGVIHIRMHFGGGATAGYPDDLFLFPNGVSLWVEFKRPGREADPLQVMRMGQLMDMGHPATVIDDIGVGRACIRQFLDAALGIEALPEAPTPLDPEIKQAYMEGTLGDAEALPDEQRGLVNDPDA